MKKHGILLVIVVLLIGACNAPVETIEATPTKRTTPVERGVSPLAEPVSPLAPAPLNSPPTTPTLEQEAKVGPAATLRALVAEQLNVAEITLKLVSAESVTWRDASLGCPQPGMEYAQVLTPGWQVIFTDAEGKAYDVHANENLSTFVICQDTVAETVAPTKPQIPAVDAAIKLVAEQLEVAVEDVTMVKAEAVEWRNSCLGCQAPGQMCLTVITPGYLVVLESGGQTFEVHTNATGSHAIFCDTPPVSPGRSDM